MTMVKKSTREIAAKLLDDMCANMQMMKSFDPNDVDEVAHSLQELLDDGYEGPQTRETEKLVVRANELRTKVAERIRADRAYYKKNNEMHEVWKAAKATAIAMRGRAGEIDALRTWLEVDIEWNNMKRVSRDEDEDWHTALDKAWRALAEDAGLHLSLPQDGEE